jgi:hypothetical protein
MGAGCWWLATMISCCVNQSISQCATPCAVQRFMKKCQLREIFVLDLLASLQHLRSRLEHMFIGTTAFSETGQDFKALHAFLKVRIESPGLAILRGHELALSCIAPLKY